MLTLVHDTVNPSANAVTRVTDVRSAPCAVIVLNDGSIVLGSLLFAEKWRFTWLP